MPLTRRELLKGLSLAAGGLGLSTVGYEHLIPFIHQPDDLIPGESTWYATSCRECPAGCGMIVRTREGRAVKCEGNPIHPVNRGKLCTRGQAALHGLYDPDRIKGPMRRVSGRLVPVSWDDAIAGVGEILRGHPRIALISDLQTGSLEKLMRAWVEALGSARLVVYEPIDYQSVKSASTAAVGTVPSFDIANTDYLASFAADFLETWISPVEYAAAFARMREIRNGKRGRFVYVGPRISMTAANADERIIVPPGAEADVALAIASQIIGGSSEFSADVVAKRLRLDPEQIRRIARGIKESANPLALPGGDAGTARAAMYLNGIVGSKAVDYQRPHAVSKIEDRPMTALIADMEAGQVDTLIISGANPVYSLPEKAHFRKALKRVANLISLSSYMDETTAAATWILPSNTPLESWGDYEPYPGIKNLMQPAMGLLFDTRPTGDILLGIAKAAKVGAALSLKPQSFHEFLRGEWGFPVSPGGGPEESSPEWEALVQNGGKFVEAPSALPWELRQAVEFPGESVAVPEVEAAAPAWRDKGIQLSTYPNVHLYDGRGANRRWLQEIPEPVTKGVWGTWVELHAITASKLGVTTSDVVRVSDGNASIEAPVLVWNGVAPGTAAIPIGQGHEQYGRYAKGVGANVWRILDQQHPVVKVEKTEKTHVVTRHKGATSQYDRNIVLTTALGEAVERMEIKWPTKKGYDPKGGEDFHPGHDHARNRWAMAIDLDRCSGCQACVAACYAENNVAVVGAEQVDRRRDMQWLRIDPYIDLKRADAPILFQPMLCQHCDSAPCEAVCPVYAAAHSDDGINMQVYNRCIGTRYCSNNCPYKVRRFNWYDYDWPWPLNYQLNPDVTVRSRGVMEKCTFCVQRIREATARAKLDGKRLKDGDVIPACVQTCPTGAFIFGDLMDPKSRISKIFSDEPRAYQVLPSLNTKPAVIYLKRVVERT